MDIYTIYKTSHRTGYTVVASQKQRYNVAIGVVRMQLNLKTYQHLILAFWGTKQNKNQNV